MTPQGYRFIAVLVVVSCTLAPRPAVAQTTGPTRGWATASFGTQSAPERFDRTQTFSANAETATVSSTYATNSGQTLNVGGGVFLLRRLGVGASFSRTTSETPANVTATVPHPFFFNQPRRATASFDGLERIESVLHLQARVVLPVASRFEVAVFGGPSRFKVEQGLIAEPRFAETYPYDQVTLTSTTERASGSRFGIHVGGDFAYYLTPHIGVGAMVQFSSATVTVGTTEITAGGPQFGGGIRLRF